LAFLFIYHQYLEKGDNLKHFQQIIAHNQQQAGGGHMSAILLIMLVNWLLESFKWRYLTRKAGEISHGVRSRRFFAG